MVEPKDVYFACAIRGEQGGKEEKEVIVATIQGLGHNVLSEIFVGQDANWNELQVMTPAQICERDINWIEQGRVVVADVTRLSIGLGLEVGWAAHAGYRVVNICREDVYPGLSNMIKGFADTKYCRPGMFTLDTWKGIGDEDNLRQILAGRLGVANG